MLRAFIKGLANKFGENVASVVWAAVIVGGPVLAWFRAPAIYVLNLSRGWAAGAVLFVLLLLASTAWVTRRVIKRQQRRRPPAPIDELQRDVLRFMWSVEGGFIQFQEMQKVIGEHANHVRIACQRLQERGYIAFNSNDPNSNVHLIDEGREYAALKYLTDATAILQRAAARALLASAKA